MPLQVEFLPEPDARWHGLPVLDVRAEALFEARLWVGVLRDGKPLFSVTLHEPPMVEAWREACCLEDCILLAGYRHVHVIDTCGPARLRCSVPLEGYFSGFTAPDDIDAPQDAFTVLVEGCCGVVRFDAAGEVIWANETLAIDGVVLHRLIDGSLLGEGEWDPPGGWVPFSLDIETGRTLVESPAIAPPGGLRRSSPAG